MILVSHLKVAKFCFNHNIKELGKKRETLSSGEQKFI